MIHLNQMNIFLYFILTYVVYGIPTHFNEFVSYLDTIHIDFKIIALSETWITKSHILYGIVNYNGELDYLPKRRGGGTSLYIH